MVSSTIEHVAITVTDMDKSIEFYTNKLGFSVINGPNPHPDNVRNVAFLMMDQVRLEIFSYKEKKESIAVQGIEGVGIHHKAFTVQNIEEYYQKLKKKGVIFTVKPRESWSGRKLAFIEDPDGILLQPIENPWLK